MRLHPEATEEPLKQIHGYGVRNSKSIICLFFAFLLCVPAFVRNLDAADEAVKARLTAKEQAFLVKHPTILLGIDQDWEPFVIVRKDGSIKGFDAEILALVNQYAGSNFKLVPGRFADMVKKAQNREIDGLSSTFPHKEREPFFNFSDTYLTMQRVVFSLKGNPYHIHSRADLSGKRLAIQEGNLFDEKLVRSVPNAVAVRENSPKDLLLAVAYGRAEALPAYPTLTYVANKYGISSLQVVCALKDRIAFVFSIRKDWPEAVSVLNKGLQAIPEDEKAAVHAKWFGVPFSPTPDYTLLLKIIVPLTLLLVILAFFIRHLQKVNDRLNEARAALESDVAKRKEVEKEREQLISELREALREIKELRGILPICSHCKKIRDDAGYWRQVENYIQDRTDAQFTHSICPDCLKKYYPDIADDVLDEIKKTE